jgi:hypothetical protein
MKLGSGKWARAHRANLRSGRSRLLMPVDDFMSAERDRLQSKSDESNLHSRIFQDDVDPSRIKEATLKVMQMPQLPDPVSLNDVNWISRHTCLGSGIPPAARSRQMEVLPEMHHKG